MAQMPIEVFEVGNVSPELIKQAIGIANALQNEFVYIPMLCTDSRLMSNYAFRRVRATDFLDAMANFRIAIRGFHPYLIAFIDSELYGSTCENLFGMWRGVDGIAVATVDGVPAKIIPEDRMVSYFLYSLARYTLSFIAPNHKSHSDPNGECVFDLKDDKCDLLKSMKARAMCDACRVELVSLSPTHLIALDKLFAESGRLLEKFNSNVQADKTRPRVFIASSSEGLGIANKIQELMEYDISAEVWNQGTVFGLGSSTLEALEHAVSNYEFGVFVFTPDDELHTRGEIKPTARDNVVFELGLFIGKLTRWRSFVLHPSKRAISLPTDLAGITTAHYDPDAPNLAAALGPACQRIREAVNEQIHKRLPNNNVIAKNTFNPTGR